MTSTQSDANNFLAQLGGDASIPTDQHPTVQRAQATLDKAELDLSYAQIRAPENGIVTKVEKEGLVAVVHIQAGPHRVVSLMTREAADELELEPGDLAVGVVKATNVVVEVPRSEER